MSDQNNYKVAGLWPNKTVGMGGNLDMGMLKDAIENGCDRITIFPNKYHEEGDNRPHYNVILSRKQEAPTGGRPMNPPPAQPEPEPRQYVEDDIPF